MAVHGDVQISRRLVMIEIIERILVHVVPIPGIAAENTMVGEIRMRQRHEGARADLNAERQVDMVVIAVPEKAFFRDVRRLWKKLVFWKQ